VEVTMMSNPQRKISDPRAGEPAAQPPSPEQQERYRKAASLLRQWRDADDGYDAEIWPLIEAELKGLRTRLRDR